MDTTTQRALSVIAREIRRDWKKVNFAAVPYLEAMLELDTMHDRFYNDDAKTIVLYFLSNASSWRGPEAKRIKAELNSMLKAK
jgi:hypothetical protein